MHKKNDFAEVNRSQKNRNQSCELLIRLNIILTGGAMLTKKKFQKTTVKPFLSTYKAVFMGKGMIFLGLLLLFLFSSIQTVKAQNPKWKVYNSGLLNNGVSCLAVDGSGNIWIGTFGGGLAKYDGTNPEGTGWTVYNTSNSGLPDNSVLCLDIDGSGNKWIGTSSGLAKYDNKNWTIYDTSNSGLPGNDVGCIISVPPNIDRNVQMWIGTDNGLAKYNGTNLTSYNTSNSGLSTDYINCLAVELSGNVWIGNELGGLVKYDGKNWTVYNTSNSGLPGIVECIAVDGSGNIWIGTWNGREYNGGGLTKYDGTDWTVYDTSNSGFPGSDVYCLAIDGGENVWIGTYGGLVKYDGTNWTFYNNSNSDLPYNGVSCLAVDRSGNKWIGTWGGLAVFNERGIVSVKDLGNKNEHYPDKFILSQNYPNPFNPSTTIKYSIPKQSYVTLKVYDLLGREVAAIVNEEKPAGNYEIKFNCVETHSHASLPSGVYFYQIKATPNGRQAGDYVSTKKMILLK